MCPHGALRQLYGLPRRILQCLHDPACICSLFGQLQRRQTQSLDMQQGQIHILIDKGLL